MRLIPARKPERRGFTLLELLVVIAIIAVLVSLTAAAVMRFIVKGDELRARHDMTQLQGGLESFKTQFNVTWIPSRIRIREDLTTYNPNDPYEAESLAYLKKLFPKLGTNAVTQVDWNGNGSLDGPVDLEGDQCLVFFLGGIPTISGGVPGCLGFSTNPSNPAAVGGDRLPHFEFRSDRLVLQPPGSQRVPNGFYSYLDAFGKNVYAYFSAYKKSNGYNRYWSYTAALNNGVGLSDCPSLRSDAPGGYGVWPYAIELGATPRYHNPETYQILCAGPDGTFGTGTIITGAPGIPQGSQVWAGAPTWTTQTASAFVALSPGIRDDMSNFHDRVLGSGD